MDLVTPTHQRVRYAVAFTTVALVFHYAWELLQCPLFVHRKGDTVMWVAMVQATSGDVVLTWIVQVFVATFARRWIWPRGAGRASWVLLFLLALVIAVAIEGHALATGRWSYAPTNPRIPGLGVSWLPVAQMVVLLPVSFLLADRWAAGRLRRRPRTS